MPIVLLLVAGLAFYAMGRANPPTSGSADLPSAVGSEATLAYADDTTFDEAVLQADGPVLVDFYADWCGPCRRLGPVLERISEDLTEGRIVKVNVDYSPEIAARYNVQNLPTLKVFVDGQVVDEAMGEQSEQTLRSMLQR
jgi:thioredoxin